MEKRFRDLMRILKKHNKIFVMAHKDLDLDAIASCIAIADISNNFKKKCYIIIDDKEHEIGVSKILANIHEKYDIISSKQVKEIVSIKDVLILVDVNNNNILQNSKICDYFNDIAVIDHHGKNSNSVNATFEIIDNKKSSASEIIASIIREFKIQITQMTATYLLSGIVLDTNDFSVKTTKDTYYAAYILSDMGADNRKVQNLLKQDIDDYKLRQKVITDLEVINKNIAFAIGSQKIKYRREELAKIADTLLEFNHIELSFVIGKMSDNSIGISGRSIGKKNVGKILEKLGGGGDKNEAAAKILDKSLNEVEEELKTILKGGLL